MVLQAGSVRSRDKWMSLSPLRRCIRFSSEIKFASGTGGPSFYAPMDPAPVTAEVHLINDFSLSVPTPSKSARVSIQCNTVTFLAAR